MVFRRALAVTAALIPLLIGRSLAIERVPARFGFLELRTDYAMPTGSYDGLPSFPFDFGDAGSFSFDADRVYDDGYAIGLSYGHLFGPHWRTSFGFDYTRNKIKNPIVQESGLYEYRISFVEDLTSQQYDFTLRATYSPLNLVSSTWSPYFGLGGALGMAGATASGYETEYEFTAALSLEAGLDFKVWTAEDDRSFLTLSSINSWDFLTTGDRARHLKIGGGLRLFFKP